MRVWMHRRIFCLALFGLALGLIGAPAALRAQAGAYKIDPKQSGFLVNTGVSGLFKKFGRNLTFEVRDYSGEIRFDPKESGASSVKLQVKSQTLALKSQATEQDRMNIEMRTHEKVLQSEKFPQIEYVSDRVQVWKTGEGRYDVDVQGHLTLHGVTRSVPLRASVQVRGNRLEAAGEATLSQKEFKIKSYAYQGGALRVADEVKISFNLVALR
ncbi:YceI family protein [Deltaproteobacteria bacterium PRO3]|nr:YceI family protein [Deltaproteobacteria bacterium PRO3]